MRANAANAVTAVTCGFVFEPDSSRNAEAANTAQHRLAIASAAIYDLPMTNGKLTDSPFLTDASRPAVSVCHGPDPYKTTRDALDSVDLSPAKGKKVLLKPNAGRIAAAGEGITTNPQVVAAAIDAFTEAGAFVALGDSPITGIKALEALDATGLAAVAKERDCPVLDLDARNCVDVRIPDGKAINSIKVCAEVTEYDLIVSIPVMKIHMHTGVSLAIKNMKGCLWRRSKVDLHMLPLVEGHDDKPLDIAIADMSFALRPQLSIIDGITGMEGLGPSVGKPKQLDTIVVGADAFAADAVACRLMGRKAEDIPHLRIGAERGYGIIDLEQVDISPGNWEDFVSPFEAPPENLSMEFPNVKILDEQSCSACQSTLLLFIQRRSGELAQYLPKDGVLNIAIGKGHDEVPPGTLCIGNCTDCHRDQGVFVPGCPPVASQILDALRD